MFKKILDEFKLSVQDGWLLLVAAVVILIVLLMGCATTSKKSKLRIRPFFIEKIL